MTFHDPLLRAADLLAGSVGMLRRPFRADDLIEIARRNTGSATGPDNLVREGLERFLHACVAEAGLGVFGHCATRWDTVRLLSNLLRLTAEERARPEILQQRIEQPIFITGLPRSGTTFLHRLLMQDRANNVPRIWQVAAPYVSARGGSDRRRERVDRQLRVFAMLAPEFRNLHPVHADSPQECSEINAHVFATLRFDTIYNVPSYRHWLDGIGHLAAYRFHKRFLQHLQHQYGARRWVLKCPDHVFALAALKTVYPDARLVFVHRDPLRVLASNARLTEVLRRPFTRRIDRLALGRQESERWLLGASLMIEASKSPDLSVFHIHHEPLTTDPVGAVRALYGHFGLDLDAATEARIGQMVEAEPNGGYGMNRHSFKDYGFDPDAEREKFRQYTDYFGVGPERGAKRQVSDVSFAL
jgi:hypothetical protein